MQRLLVATTNAGKLREIQDVLRDAPIELVSLADVTAPPVPEETGETFEANARLKALYYASHSGLLTVAEDSGLVIDALDGAPGIHSARYLGAEVSYPERFAAIQRALASRPERPRTARFVCALAVAQPSHVVFQTTQTVEGVIAEDASGTAGFGYDPIFVYPPYGRTLAEVTQQEKLDVAHRGKAFRVFAVWLNDHLGRDGSG